MEESNTSHDEYHYFDVDNETGNVYLSSVLATTLAGNYRNAVPYLHELCQKYKFSEPELFSKMVFGGYSYFVKVNGVNYPAGNVCNTKKEAKQFACLVALEHILASKSINMMFTKKTPQIDISSVVVNFELLPDNLFTVVGETVGAKFEEFVEIIGQPLKKAKCTAAVLVHDAYENKFRVVSAASGNQSISGDGLTFDGSVLNDCHGEILARRSFIRFLYLHIIKEYGTDNFMFKHAKGSKLELKSRYSFHLYISTTPCGDGRIFSMAEIIDNRNNAINPVHEPLFEDIRKQGLLRCKVENGHGSIPICEICDSGVQTVDGIIGGDRLLTMSCSDKILKWNVLGIQGSLLATFMEPLYLSSITIGSLYHHGHMSRAVCCRLTDMSPNLPRGYRLNHPLLGQTGNNKDRDISKAKSICSNWNAMEKSIIEIVQGQEGTTKSKIIKSRISKVQFFRLYKLLQRRLSSKPIDDKLLYSHAKRANLDYQNAKELFMQTLKSKGHGSWLNKPSEEKLFR